MELQIWKYINFSANFPNFGSTGRQDQNFARKWKKSAFYISAYKGLLLGTLHVATELQIFQISGYYNEKWRIFEFFKFQRAISRARWRARTWKCPDPLAPIKTVILITSYVGFTCVGGPLQRIIACPPLQWRIWTALFQFLRALLLDVQKTKYAYNFKTFLRCWIM